MTKGIFQQLAAYNRWANARLYAAALELSDQAYRLHIGVFFSSVHGTLNHLLLADRMWLKRLTGEGEHPDRWMPSCSKIVGNSPKRVSLRMHG